MLIKLKRSYPLLLVLTTILAAQTPQLVAQGQGKPMLETAPAGGVLADCLRRLEPIALTDCGYLQMQKCVFRMAAILYHVLLCLVGRPNFHYKRVRVAFSKMSA